MQDGDTKLFQELNAAYQVLSDPERRAEYDDMLSRQTSQQYSSSDPNAYRTKQSTDRYTYPSNEDTNNVIFVLNKLVSYFQIPGILLEIKPLLDIVRAKSTASDYLNFSSLITIWLMNVIIEDVNQITKRHHAYHMGDVKRIRLAYQVMELIETLDMDEETRNVYSQRKSELEAMTYTYSGQKLDFISKTIAWIITISCAAFMFMLDEKSLYSCFRIFLLANILYSLLYYILSPIIVAINSICWNIKLFFSKKSFI